MKKFLQTDFKKPLKGEQKSCKPTFNNREKEKTFLQTIKYTDIRPLQQPWKENKPKELLISEDQNYATWEWTETQISFSTTNKIHLVKKTKIIKNTLS